MRGESWLVEFCCTCGDVGRTRFVEDEPGDDAVAREELRSYVIAQAGLKPHVCKCGKKLTGRAVAR